jgi:hypothetical protein
MQMPWLRFVCLCILHAPTHLNPSHILASDPSPSRPDLPHYLRQRIAAFVMFDTVSSLRLFKGALGTEAGLEALVAQHMRPVDIAPGEGGRAP